MRIQAPNLSARTRAIISHPAYAESVDEPLKGRVFALLDGIEEVLSGLFGPALKF